MISGKSGLMNRWKKVSYLFYFLLLLFTYFFFLLLICTLILHCTFELDDCKGLREKIGGFQTSQQRPGWDYFYVQVLILNCFVVLLLVNIQVICIFFVLGGKGQAYWRGLHWHWN